MYPRFAGTYLCTYLGTFQPNINNFIKLFLMPRDIFTLDHVS